MPHHAEVIADTARPILATVKRLMNAPRCEEIVAAVDRENAAMAKMLRTGLSENALRAFTPPEP